MAVLLISVWCSLLIACDLRWRRLPDLFTLPGALGIALWAAHEGRPGALVGGFAWAGLYLLTAVTTGGIGGGDIKFALGLGTLAAFGGISSWLLAVVTASASTLLLALIIWVRTWFRGAVDAGETGRNPVPVLPHGPSMVVGATGAFLLHIRSAPDMGWVM